jgi:hypothetical protein
MARTSLNVDDFQSLLPASDTAATLQLMNIYREKLAIGFANYRQLFRRFVEVEILPLFQSRDTDYQIPPTFRVHLRGSASSSIFHRDRDYGVPQDCLNVWIPFCDVSGTNSILIETFGSPESMTAISLKYGQLLIFDGPNLLHGSVTNDSGRTRVSMDFRFRPRHGKT